MGVTRLYNFMEKIDALRQVKISEEVQNYRRRTNQSPVIAVDAISLMYEVCRYNHLPYLYGGQLKEYKKHLEFFIGMFQKEGVDLVFFFDGANVMYNVDGWIKRKRENIKFVHSVFDKVEHGSSIGFIENNKKEILPRNIFTVTVFVIKQKGCKVKLSLAECDKEIALYAKRNDCMGILAIDTDFIIFDSVKTYTLIGMDLTEMKFYVYDKRKFLESLMLRSCELPLFASLAGNDYIPVSDLYYGFHAKFRKRGDNKNDLKIIFLGIAQYIRRLNLKISNSDISKDVIKKISKNVFPNETKSELLQESINFYNLRLEQNGLTTILRKIPDHNWCSIVKLFCENLADQGDNCNIIARSCFQDSIYLEDFRCSDIPPSSTILIQLRKKLYGLLLFEKVGSKNVEEWIIDDIMILNKPHYVSPYLPNVHHPGLISLLEGNDQESQWLLAGDLFNINPIAMKKLPKHLLIPALAFRYVKDKVMIDDIEMNVLILSAILANYFNAQELHTIIIDKVKSRAITLYTLVTCCFELVFQIFQILKNLIPAEMALSTNYQDGKLFHLIYNMSYDQKIPKEEVLVQVLDIFENKIKLFETCKEQIDEIITFIAI